MTQLSRQRALLMVERCIKYVDLKQGVVHTGFIRKFQKDYKIEQGDYQELESFEKVKS